MASSLGALSERREKWPGLPNFYYGAVAQRVDFHVSQAGDRFGKESWSLGLFH